MVVRWNILLGEKNTFDPAVYVLFYESVLVHPGRWVLERGEQ